MLSHLYSVSLLGLECKLIDVEVDFRRGNYAFHIVGLADKSVQESKERISSAIKNSGFIFTPMVTIANLAPAELPKTGSSFDLPMALGYLSSSEQLDTDFNKKIFIGELGLDGIIRPVNGVLPIVDFARKNGFKEVYIPFDNLSEASFIEGIDIYPVKSLKEIVWHLRNFSKLNPIIIKKENISQNSNNLKATYDFSDIKGQMHAKRALEICAAGSHNILLHGPPGSGKTMLARSLPGIMPNLTLEESLEVTKIYSISGLTHKLDSLITQRPFRSPHNTASYSALIGGGVFPRPGEISLSHRGVLFLDEFPEFPNQSIEALRQPLEDKIVTISRVHATLTFPANFLLIAAMNPCKCGFLNDPNNVCKCTMFELNSYRKKLSGPILDRIDLMVNVPKVENKELFMDIPVENSKSVKERVQRARDIQVSRYKPLHIFSNSELKQSDFKKYLNIDPSAGRFLEVASNKLNISARRVFKLMKISRTIADLELSDYIEEQHIKQAFSYRISL